MKTCIFPADLLGIFPLLLQIALFGTAGNWQLRGLHGVRCSAIELLATEHRQLKLKM